MYCFEHSALYCTLRVTMTLASPKKKVEGIHSDSLWVIRGSHSLIQPQETVGVHNSSAAVKVAAE